MGSPIVPALRATNKQTQADSLTELAAMSLDLYTRNIPLTQKARFWGNYVSALKGTADLCAAPEPRVTNIYPSITETIPPTYSDLRNEFGKLENLMWRQNKAKSVPTPTLPAANDRIHTLGYNYCLFIQRSMDHTGARLLEDPCKPSPQLSQ